MRALLRSAAGGWGGVLPALTAAFASAMESSCRPRVESAQQRRLSGPLTGNQRALLVLKCAGSSCNGIVDPHTAASTLHASDRVPKLISEQQAGGRSFTGSDAQKQGLTDCYSLPQSVLHRTWVDGAIGAGTAGHNGQATRLPAAPCSPAGRSHRPHGSLRTPGARGLDAQAARRMTCAIHY